MLPPPLHVYITSHQSLRTLSVRQDNEIAQEIQDQLVRQAEQQRQQEEKDAVRHTHTHRLTDFSAHLSTALIPSTH